MKLVIDTNVVVSAAVADRKPEIVILFIASSNITNWIVSSEILQEYQEVLLRKRLKLGEEQKATWLTLITSNTVLINISLKYDFPRDRKDAKFLACAVETEAYYLITGDKDFEEVKSLGNTKIISVSLFKSLVIDKDE